MNSDDLAFFTLVADAGSLSAAALAGGLDTSTVSRRIGQLEKHLDVRLCRRSGRGMALTVQGETLLTHARQVQQALAAAREAVAGDARQGPARIRIAAQPTIALTLFGDLFHALQARFPASRLQFGEGLASSILADLQAGTVDMAVLYRPEYPGAVAYEPLLLERLYLLAPPGYAMTMTQARLDADGLAGVPLVLPSTHHGLRVTVEAMAARRGFTPLVALENDSSNALTLELVRKGCGCTVLPLAAAAAEIAQGRLQGFALPGDDAERCVCLVLGRSAMEARNLWALAALVREVVTRLATSGAWLGARPVKPPKARPGRAAPPA
ncbi:LysR family transcriptional regulator [Xylophilus sp.]|uniref:LysR family transcriptional regulator n=1 Tax=Xylophilus sp. TaxID=2653893 RepID=UPI0013BAF457|nr:LysR family transcriptional regulator [Xylophilus sp.]KAF1050182.1 MAG: HTH-type transcriptional regulator CynR [Xylophilus sp.]